MNHTILAALLRGNQNHTITTARTVNGTGCTILQDVERSDIVGVQVGQVTTRYTVDNNQRAEASRTAADTTNLDAGLIVRVAGSGIGDGYTSHLTLNHHRGVNAAGRKELLVANVSHGRGQLLLVHRTVTDNHHFAQQLAILLHLQVDARTAVNLYLLSLVTDAREYQHLFATYSAQRVVTIDVGGATT